MDLIVSSIHGRPSATENHRPDLAFTADASVPSNSGDTALVAAYELSEMVSSIVNDLYGNKSIKAATANRYLQSLQHWLVSLPADVRLASLPQNLDPTAKEQVLGSLHVSAYYYHVVMLVTRPFMITHLIKKLAAHKKKPSMGQASVSGADWTSDDETTMLAHACTNAAIYLTQISHEVLQSGFLLLKMPLIEYVYNHSVPVIVDKV